MDNYTPDPVSFRQALQTYQIRKPPRDSPPEYSVWLKRGGKLLWISPEELVGRGMKTRAIVDRTGKYGALISISNVFNSVTSIPAIYLIASGAGAITGGSITIFFSLAVNGVANFATNTAIAEVRSKKKGFWQRVCSSPGLTTFVLLNLGLTSLSLPVGTYITSQKALADRLAASKLVEIEAGVDSYSDLLRKKFNLDAREKDCERNVAEINRLGEKPGSERNNTRVNLMNRYTGGKAASPYPKGTVCGDVEADQKTVQGLVAESMSKLDQVKKASAVQGLPAIAAIKNYYPEVYRAYFDGEGTISDSSLAIAETLGFVLEALVKLNLGVLLMPAITLLISTSLSIGAIRAVITLGTKDAIKMTFDPKAVDAFSHAKNIEIAAIEGEWQELAHSWDCDTDDFYPTTSQRIIDYVTEAYLDGKRRTDSPSPAIANLEELRIQAERATGCLFEFLKACSEDCCRGITEDQIREAEKEVRRLEQVAMNLQDVASRRGISTSKVQKCLKKMQEEMNLRADIDLFMRMPTPIPDHMEYRRNLISELEKAICSLIDRLERTNNRGKFVALLDRFNLRK